MCLLKCSLCMRTCCYCRLCIGCLSLSSSLRCSLGIRGCLAMMCIISSEGMWYCMSCMCDWIGGGRRRGGMTDIEWRCCRTDRGRCKVSKCPHCRHWCWESSRGSSQWHSWCREWMSCTGCKGKCRADNFQNLSICHWCIADNSQFSYRLCSQW